MSRIGGGEGVELEEEERSGVGRRSEADSLGG